jgi:hypothetical protein
MAEDQEKDQPEMTEEIVVPGGLHPPKVVKKPREQPAPSDWQPTSGSNALQLVLLSVIATLLLVGVVVGIVWVTRPGPEIVERPHHDPREEVPVSPEEAEPKPVTDAESEAGSEPEPGIGAESESATETQTKTEIDVEAKTEPDSKVEPETVTEPNLTAVLVSLSPSALTSDVDATVVVDHLEKVLQKLQDTKSPMSSDDRRRIHSWLRTIPMESVSDQVKQQLFDIRAWSWYGADDAASLDRSGTSVRGDSDSLRPQVRSAEAVKGFAHEFIVGLVISRASSGALLLATCLTSEPTAASTAPPSAFSQREQVEWNYCQEMIEKAKDELHKAIYHFRLANLCLQAARRIPPIDSETFEILIEMGLEHFRHFEQYANSIRETKGASLIPTTEVQECRSELLLGHRVALARKAARRIERFRLSNVNRFSRLQIKSSRILRGTRPTRRSR